MAGTTHPTAAGENGVRPRRSITSRLGEIVRWVITGHAYVVKNQRELTMIACLCAAQGEPIYDRLAGPRSDRQWYVIRRKG
jgi:hypothetical protein